MLQGYHSADCLARDFVSCVIRTGCLLTFRVIVYLYPPLPPILWNHQVRKVLTYLTHMLRCFVTGQQGEGCVLPYSSRTDQSQHFLVPSTHIRGTEYGDNNTFGTHAVGDSKAPTIDCNISGRACLASGSLREKEQVSRWQTSVGMASTHMPRRANLDSSIAWRRGVSSV